MGGRKKEEDFLQKHTEMGEERKARIRKKVQKLLDWEKEQIWHNLALLAMAKRPDSEGGYKMYFYLIHFSTNVTMLVWSRALFWLVFYFWSNVCICAFVWN